VIDIDLYFGVVYDNPDMKPTVCRVRHGISCVFVSSGEFLAQFLPIVPGQAYILNGMPLSFRVTEVERTEIHRIKGTVVPAMESQPHETLSRDGRTLQFEFKDTIRKRGVIKPKHAIIFFFIQMNFAVCKGSLAVELRKAFSMYRNSSGFRLSQQPPEGSGQDK